MVDDDEHGAASVTALLSALGLRAETYDSADAFLETYDGRSIACLGCDMRLPAMSGLELRPEFMTKRKQIPIVMISGHADRELSIQTLENGAVAYLEKPYAGEKLYEAIRISLLAAGSRSRPGGMD